jgi:hypothetical protein
MGGLYGSANFSPPSDDEEPNSRRLRTSTPELLSVPRSLSRQSRASSGFEGSPGRRLNRSTPEVDSASEASERRPSLRRGLRDEEGELIIEEMADDDSTSHVSQSRILQPDALEDAESERAASPFNMERSDMFRRFEDLYHGDDDEQGKQQHDKQRWRNKKKRWSQRSKRTFSESCGSDMDDEDVRTLDFNEVGSSARRVRRRMSGVKERKSLIFEDPPPGHITEVDEPDDEVSFIDAPPYYEEVDWNAQLQNMPFYGVPNPMRIDDNEDNSGTSGVESDSSIGSTN